MKRIVCFVLTVCMAFGLTACADSDTRLSGKLRLAALKGLTAIGISKLYDDVQNDSASLDYEITLESTVDAISAGLKNKAIDAAVIQSNVAATLFTGAGLDISVAALAVEGGMHLLSRGGALDGLSSLEGKKIISTGRGAVPEYVLKTLLTEGGVSYSEDDLLFFPTPAEAISALKLDQADIILLPKPFTEVAIAQVNGLEYAFDLADEFERLELGRIIVGVLVVRNNYLKYNRQSFDTFMQDYHSSVEFVTNPDNADTAAQLSVDIGVVPSLAIANEAFKSPMGIIFESAGFKDSLSGFLSLLASHNPACIGGSLPSDGFYLS